MHHKRLVSLNCRLCDRTRADVRSGKAAGHDDQSRPLVSSIRALPLALPIAALPSMSVFPKRFIRPLGFLIMSLASPWFHCISLAPARLDRLPSRLHRPCRLAQSLHSLAASLAFLPFMSLDPVQLHWVDPQ